MLWVGVDIALRRTGFVIFDDKLSQFLTWDVFILPKKYEHSFEGTLALYHFYYHKLSELLDPEKEYIFVVEGETQFGHCRAMQRIGIARGTFYLALRDVMSTDVLVVYQPMVQTWKHHLAGNNKAGKEKVREVLLEKYAYIPHLTEILEDDDTMDAAALVFWGIEHGRKWKAQQDSSNRTKSGSAGVQDSLRRSLGVRRGRGKKRSTKSRRSK